jgi:hypothetical protein
VRAEAHGKAAEARLDHAAERVAVALRLVDALDDGGLGARSKVRSGLSSSSPRRSQSMPPSQGTPAMATTRAQASTPASASSRRATAPAATREAVSRALARSSTSRRSLWPYLMPPVRSAWPGRAAVSAFLRGSPPGSGSMISVQLRQSRFSICMATGAPVVRPARTPPRKRAPSVSITWRRPRP